MRTKWTAAAAALALAAPAIAQDTANGRSLAEYYCAECHDIADGGAMQTYPPSFDSIAVFRSDEQIWSRIIFPAWHSSMPEWARQMDSSEVDDLRAYIRSLE